MSKSLVVYGIPNCDSVRRARAWLEVNGHAHAFHDVRTKGLTTLKLADWIDRLGSGKVLNRASTTFRSLDDADKARADGPGLAGLIVEHPTLMRRPVLEGPALLLAGFKEGEWRAALGSNASD